MAGVVLNGFRDYANAPQRVVDSYRLHRALQTMSHIEAQRNLHFRFDRSARTLKEQISYLNLLRDDTDPDTDLSQEDHLVQTWLHVRERAAEYFDVYRTKGFIKDDTKYENGYPPWLEFIALFHDVPKVLALPSEEGAADSQPQYMVVGDTFVAGAPPPKHLIYRDFLLEFNPDYAKGSTALRNGQFGFYRPNIGLDNVLVAWGHDWYGHGVAENYFNLHDTPPAGRLPLEALAMQRYHSLYAWHRGDEVNKDIGKGVLHDIEPGYLAFMDEKDWKMLPWVRFFQLFDLYEKHKEKPDTERLRQEFETILGRHMPGAINW